MLYLTWFLTNKSRIPPKMIRYNDWTENQWKKCPKKKSYRPSESLENYCLRPCKYHKKVWLIENRKMRRGLNTFAQYSITYDRPEVFASFLLMKNPVPCCECFSSLIDQYMMNLIIMWLQGALSFVPTCSKRLKPALYLVNIELHLEAKEPDIFLIKTLQFCG